MERKEVNYYNMNQKMRYLDEREIEYRSIKLVCKTFFNTAKEYEEKLAKDCSCFTSMEILNMYSSCATRSWEQLLNFNSQLKIYTAWCIKEGLVPDNQNHYEEIDKDDMYRCLNLGLKKVMVITRAELEKTIKKNTFDNVSEEFLVLAFFEGLGGMSYKDFDNLMLNQFHDGKVDLDGRTLEVSKMLIEKAIQSAETYEKYSNKEPVRVGYNKLDPSVVKDSANVTDIESETRNLKKIQRRIQKLEKSYGKEYGYAALHNSGRIDMIRRLMDEDKSDDIRETFNKHREEIEYRYGRLQRVARWIEENEQFFDKELSK